MTLAVSSVEQRVSSCSVEERVENARRLVDHFYKATVSLEKRSMPARQHFLELTFRANSAAAVSRLVFACFHDALLLTHSKPLTRNSVLEIFHVPMGKPAIF